MPIKENLEKIKRAIPKAVTLVAAVKYASKEEILELVKYGTKDLGFNTYQQLRSINPVLPSDSRIHFIGHLQSNKIKKVLQENIYLVQSVDSYELAEKINKIAIDLKINQKILLQVRTDKNKKYGIDTGQLENVFFEIKNNLPNVNIMGLMTIPPLAENPETARKYFSLVKTGYDELSKKSNKRLEYLSMGMSGDYSIAIEEGANMVRIGRMIFGQ